MKRIIVFLLFLSLCLTLFACDGTQTGENPSNEDQSSGTSTPSGEPTTDQKPEADTEPDVLPANAIRFVSNEDGTCYVDGLILSSALTRNTVISIPEYAPNGDRVTEIRSLGMSTGLPPLIIDAEAFETHLVESVEERLAQLDPSSDEYEILLHMLMTIEAWYVTYNESEELRQGILNNLCGTVPSSSSEMLFYVLDETPGQEPVEAERIRLFHYFMCLTDYDPATSPLTALERSLAKAYPDSPIAKNLEKRSAPIYSSYSYITSVTLPSSVKAIAPRAFANLTAVTTLTIPEGVTEIRGGTFLNCRSLTSLTLPKSITVITDTTNDDLHASPFFACTSLSTIYYGGTTEEWYSVSINLNCSLPSSCTVVCQDE